MQVSGLQAASRCKLSATSSHLCTCCFLLPTRFFRATPSFSLKRRAFFKLRPHRRYFCPLNNSLAKPQNCPHCGQKWPAGRRKASGLSPALPLAASPSAEIHPQASFFCICHSRNAPARRRNVRFSDFRRVRARLGGEIRTNRRHGRDGL